MIQVVTGDQDHENANSGSPVTSSKEKILLTSFVMGTAYTAAARARTRGATFKRMIVVGRRRCRKTTGQSPVKAIERGI